MALFTNTNQTDLAAIQTLAADICAVSSTFTTNGKLSVNIEIIHAKDNASASVGAGTKYTVEQYIGGDWRPVVGAFVQAGITAPTAMVTDGIENAGQTVIECGAVVPAIDDIICFKNANILLTEFKRVVARVTTGGSETVTIKDALTNQQAQGTYYTQVEMFNIKLDLKGIIQLRVHANNNLGTTNRAVIWQVSFITCDSIG